MPKKLIGHMPCPECGFADAEVADDKSGNPYRYCPDCNAQFFTRGDPTRVKNLRDKMRPVKVDPPPPGKKPDPPAPVKRRGLLDDLKL